MNMKLCACKHACTLLDKVYGLAEDGATCADILLTDTMADRAYPYAVEVITETGRPVKDFLDALKLDHAGNRFLGALHTT